MAIKDLLTNKSRKEKATVKAQELAKENLDSFTIRGIEVDIEEQPVYEQDCVKIVIKAKKGADELAVDNPYYFYNPPVLVPTGTTHIVHDDIAGDIDVPDYEENAQLALQENIIQTLEKQIKRRAI